MTGYYCSDAPQCRWGRKSLPLCPTKTPLGCKGPNRITEREFFGIRIFLVGVLPLGYELRMEGELVRAEEAVQQATGKPVYVCEG